MLLLLAVWLLRDRDRPTAERVGGMLPVGHPVVVWVPAETRGKLTDGMIDDLGDPLSADRVLLFLNPKPKRRK